MATTTATLTLSSSDLLSDNLALSTTMNLYKNGTTATGLVSGYAQSEIFPDDPQGNPAGLSTEPDERLAPVEFAYQNLGINASDAYSNLTYCREDLGYISQPLYQQETLQVG